MMHIIIQGVKEAQWDPLNPLARGQKCECETGNQEVTVLWMNGKPESRTYIHISILMQNIRLSHFGLHLMMQKLLMGMGCQSKTELDVPDFGYCLDSLPCINICLRHTSNFITREDI